MIARHPAPWSQAALHEVARLRVELDLALAQVPQWIACSERMPTLADGVVLGGAVGYQTGMVWISDSPPDSQACKGCPKGPHFHGALWPLGGAYHALGSIVTHWQPLPSLPKGPTP